MTTEQHDNGTHSDRSTNDGNSGRSQNSGYVYLDLTADYTSLSLIGASLDKLLEHIDLRQDRETLIYQTRLAVHETCTNIIDHSYGADEQVKQQDTRKRIQVAMSFCQNPRRLVIDLYDTGAAADLPAVQLPQAGESDTGGYGLFLIHQLMDQVTYEHSPERNHWRLEKYL